MGAKERQTIAALSKPTVLDRVVNFLSPVRGAQRMHARYTQAVASAFMGGGWGGYNGAKFDRKATQAWGTTYRQDANRDQLPDLPVLRDRSRDLLRNAPLAAGAVSTVVQNVVGTGLELMAKPDATALGWSADQAAKWKATTEREFRLWATTPIECDVTRTQTFYQLQALVFRSTLESGDTVTLLPMLRAPGCVYQTKVQVIEADRLANPQRWLDGHLLTDTEKQYGGLGNRIYGGVELDAATGAPVAYNILRAHPGSFEGQMQWATDRYLAFGAKTGRRNVVHLFDKLRPGQTRGVPYLAPIIETLKQMDRYSEAELMAAVVSAMFTVFVTTPGGEGMGQGLSAQMGGGTPTGAASKEALQLGNGAVLDLAPGEDVKTAAMNRPNPNYDGFLQAFLRQIGACLGLPFEVLTKHFTSSYSAARAALMEAWKFYMGRRAWVAVQFCQPVYEAWMDEAVATGRISAPGYFNNPALRRAYLGADWIGDAQGQIDPVKEVTAAEKRLAIGVSTLEEETLQLTGGVWEEKHEQQVKEMMMRRKDGLIPGTPLGAPLAPQDQGRALNPGEGESTSGVDSPDQAGPDQADQQESGRNASN